MNTRERLQKRLTEKNILVLDGAMGTEILHHGVATTLPLWSAQALLTHPQVVQRIHEEYVKAGGYPDYRYLSHDTARLREGWALRRGGAQRGSAGLPAGSTGD